MTHIWTSSCRFISEATRGRVDFAAGLILGSLLGVATTLGILLFVAAIPSEKIPTTQRLSYSGLALAALLILGVTVAVRAMNLRDGALTLFLLLIVLASSRLRGLLTGLAAAAFAALVLCVVFPPAWSMKVEQSRDQLLVGAFIVCCAIGCHLASVSGGANLRAPSFEAERSAHNSLGGNMPGQQES